MKFLMYDWPRVSSRITEMGRVPFIISTSTALAFRSKIATYIFGKGTWIIIRGHIKQYAVGLTNGIKKLSVNGTLAVYGLQVVHPVNAFPLKNFRHFATLPLCHNKVVAK